MRLTSFFSSPKISDLSSIFFFGPNWINEFRLNSISIHELVKLLVFDTNIVVEKLIAQDRILNGPQIRHSTIFLGPCKKGFEGKSFEINPAIFFSHKS